MKAHLAKLPLENALRLAALLTKSIGVLSLGGRVRLSDQGDHALLLEAADAIHYLRASLAAKVIEPGSCSISGSRLLAVLHASKSPQLRLSSRGQHDLLLLTGDVRANLFGIDPKDFTTPIISQDFDAELETDVGTLQRISMRVSRALLPSGDEVFCGLHLFSQDGRLVAEATDHHRIHRERTEIPVRGKLDVVLPGETIPLWHTIFNSADKDGLVTLRFTSRTFRLDLSPTLTLQGALAEGTFPPLDRFLTQDHPQSHDLPRAELGEAVDSAARFLSGVPNTTGVQIDAQAECTVVSADAPEVGTFESRLLAPCEHPVKFCLAHRYLKDLVASLDGDRIAFDFTEPTAPILIRENDFIAVVAPIRRPPPPPRDAQPGA